MNSYFCSDSSEGRESAIQRGRSLTDKLYDLTDVIMFIAGLNALMFLTTLIGGIVFGWSPALAAAVECSRTRLRHESQPLGRSFFTSWRTHFISANLLQAPGNILLVILGLNYLALHDTMPLIAGPTIVAGVLIIVIQIIAVGMDAHYNLNRSQCLRQAFRFCLHFPAGSVLLAATVVLAVTVTRWVPGLTLVSFGAAAYICTALVLSFFSTNDLHVTTTSPTGLPTRKEIN